MNVLVIVSDTLRRDRLGFYRDAATRAANAAALPEQLAWVDRLADTPNLDGLAARAAIFDRYYAASFPTLPARADLLTGKLTFSFMKWEPLPRAETSVSKTLSDAGVMTVGVVDTPFYTHAGNGFDRGFRYFYEHDGQWAAVNRQLFPTERTTELDYNPARTFTLAERALERIHKQPFLLWVDTWDPHEPWDPPHEDARRYKSDYDGRVVEPTYNLYREAGVAEDDLETARACYLGEITLVDRWLGRLLARLDTLAIAETTAVLFLSDHGFHMGEHGFFGKMVQPNTWADKFLRGGMSWGRSPIYEDLAHVPLLLAIPGEQPRRVPGLVSAADIMPTILDLAGVDPPPGQRIQGRSVVPLARGAQSAGRDLVVTTTPLVNPGEQLQVVDGLRRHISTYQPATLTTAEWSLLYSARGEPVELYHLPSDPGQEHDVAAAHGGVVADIHGQYVDLLRHVGTPPIYLEPRAEL